MYSISPLGKIAHFDEISYSGPYTYLSLSLELEFPLLVIPPST